MKKIMGVAVVLVAALALSASAAKADTVIVMNPGNGCGGSTCFGNVFTLTIHPTGGNSFTVTLDVDTSGNTNPGTAIGGVDFKFAGDIVTVSLTSAPGGTSGWGTNTSNLSGGPNGGCGTSLSPGFGCSEDTLLTNFSVTQSSSQTPPTYPTALAGLPNNGVYTWTWNVTTSGALLVGSDVHIGAAFGHIATQTTGCGKNCSNTTYFWSGTNGLLSGTEQVPPPPRVPEPGTVSLVGLGLLGLAGRAALGRFRA